MDQIFLMVNEWITAGSMLAILGCFLWGVISVLFSPCHLAAIPLIVSYVAGQNKVLKPKEASWYAIIFTVGYFITLAAIGFACSLLGRMLGDVGSYWMVLVGVVLIWLALDMLELIPSVMSGGAMSRLKIRGMSGAFVLGLSYGVLSGPCTFGWMAPVLAFITIQQKIFTGLIYISVFAIGECIPIAVAGSSAAMVKRILESGTFQQGSHWFRRLAGVVLGLFGIYFVFRPFFPGA